MQVKRHYGLAGLLLLLAGFDAAALEAAGDVKVTELAKETTHWDGAPIVYPQGQAEMTALLIEIAPGGETGWHSHPVGSFAYILDGTLEVRLDDGRVNRLQSGEVLAEVVDRAHNGRNVGSSPLKLVVFYTGAKGIPLTVKQAPPEKAE